MDREDDIISKAIAANKILKASESKPIDMSAYRGNLFKQTLGADWDKPKATQSQHDTGGRMKQSNTKLDNWLT